MPPFFVSSASITPCFRRQVRAVLGLVRPIFASSLDSFCASFPFLPFPLGTASGEFLRPAASCLLLFRFLPKNFGSNREVFCAPPEMQTLALGADPSRFRVPQL